MHTIIQIQTKYGLQDITKQIQEVLAEKTGILYLFLQHTSASLLINEGADADVQKDLQQWIEKIAPESSDYIHSYEGPDDMPAHIRAALTSNSLTIPVERGKMLLGTWQKIFLWEHRKHPKKRSLVISLS